MYNFGQNCLEAFEVTHVRYSHSLQCRLVNQHWIEGGEGRGGEGGEGRGGEGRKGREGEGKGDGDGVGIEEEIDLEREFRIY